jgi:hypothetical protein
MISLGFSQLKSQFKGYSYENHLNDVINSVIVERIVLFEDENNKLTDNNFNIENHLVPFIEIFIKSLLSDVDNTKFESDLRRAFLLFIGNLFEDLSNSYSSGKRGASHFLNNNISYLLKCIIGPSAYNELNTVNELFIEKFIESLLEYYYVERCKKDIDLCNNSEVILFNIDYTFRSHN